MDKRVNAYYDYSTVDGDTWTGIAYKHYGVEQMASALMAFNIEQAHILVFPAGVKLRIPEFDEDQSPESLAPWRT